MKKEIIAKLDAPFDEARVKAKKVGDRPEVSYLESYDVIDKANEVFGYGQWGTELQELDIRETGGKTIVIAQLALDVTGCASRVDVGAVVAAQKAGKPCSPEALETAVKGAVSDALKRALRQFGTQFGNSLYDKERNGKAPRPLPVAPKGQKGGKVSSDPMSAFWRYAKEHDVEGSAKEILKQQGDPEKALILLKEQCE